MTPEILDLGYMLRALKFVVFQSVSLFTEQAPMVRASSRGSRILHFLNRRKCTNLLKPDTFTPSMEGINISDSQKSMKNGI